MIPLTVVIVVVLLLVLYYYVKYVYFTLRGPIPGLPPQFLVGNLLQTGILRQNVPINVVFLQLKAKLGDIFQFWLGPTRIIVVSDLEDVQYIFAHRHVYDQGDIFVEKICLINPNAILGLKGAKYKRHASIVSPLFRRGRISAHMETIIDCTDKLLARWRTNYNDPTKVHLNMIEQSQQLLLAISGLVIFNYDLQTFDDESDNHRNELCQALHTHLNVVNTLIKLPSIVGRLYLLLNLEYQQSRRIIEKYLQQMIEQELTETSTMRAERKRTSFIASLVDSLQRDENLEATKPEENKKGLSRSEVIGEMLSFLSAGYSTTSTVLVWFIYFMSKNPLMQSKLKRELTEYHCQNLSVEQLDSLVYLDCVLRELFRFVPALIGTVRTLTTDDRLPASGIQLSKGEQVLIPFYNFGQDPRHWPGPIDPDQFYPERFLNEVNNKVASITFGGGHRQCMGQDFARLELKTILARLMQFVTFGDGGVELNSGGYKQTDTILPKHIGVMIAFD